MHFNNFQTDQQSLQYIKLENQSQIMKNSSSFKPTLTNRSNKLKMYANLPKMLIIVSIISLTTFTCGALIAYIIALGIRNVRIIYGQQAVKPVVRGFLIASLPLSISLGTLIGPWILPHISRRNLTLILCLAGLCTFGIIQIQNLAAFYVVRILQGTIAGIFLVLIPVYVKEITPKEISRRHQFGVFEKLFFLAGFVAMFAMNTIMLRNQLDERIRWRVVVTACAFPLLLVVILIFIGVIPQSPVSLILKGKQEEARKVIGMFHHEKWVNAVFLQKQKEAQAILKNLKGPPVVKQTSILVKILSFQIPFIHQFTGVNAYISQMGLVTSFYNQGFSEFVPLLMTVIQLIGAIVSIFYITKITPKTIILIGNLGMGLCCIGIGTCLMVIDGYKQAFWIIIALISVFMGLNGGTFIPAVGIYVSEASTSVMTRWSLVANWFSTGSSVVIFVTVSSQVGYGAVFYGFGTITLIGFIFNIIFMFQTRSKIKKDANIRLIALPREQILQRMKQKRESLQTFQTAAKRRNIQIQELVQTKSKKENKSTDT